MEKMSVRPDQIIDYKALCGDKSDCIPGVKGIGDKTAIDLLKQFDTLAGVYESIEKVPGSKQVKLKEGREDAIHSQFLAKIITDIPLGVEIASTVMQGFEINEVMPILRELELQRFLKTIDSIHQTLGGEPEPESSEDMWFFDEGPPVSSTQSLVLSVRIIQTVEQLQELAKILDEQHDIPVAWDTETTALIARDAQLVGIGCCWGNDIADVAYIPLLHTNGQTLELEVVWQHLRPILQSPTHSKVLQNAKFDRLILRHQGIELAGVVADTMLMSYALDPDKTHNLTDLAKRYLSIESTSYTDLVPKGQTISDIAIPAVAQYCGMDVYATRGVYLELLAELTAEPTLLNLWQSIEQPLEPVLADMEDLGIRIDVDYLAELSAQLQETLATIEEDAYQAADSTFNLASPKQMAELLFDRLALPTKGIRKTKTGYSTDVNTLEKLQGQHSVVDLILQHRTLSKLKSTYTDALPKLVQSQTGRVHTDFNQAVTSTGRLSSSDPNLQNIPIRTDFSRQLRKAFIPQSGWILVTADYSQIELRILAHLSQEPVLLDAYQTQQDIHTITAKLLFEKEQIDSEERRMGKIINFGVIYGMGAGKFSREAGLPVTVGKDFIEKYYQRYPGIFRYLERVKKQAISQGFVETICGRRRNFQFESGRLRKLQGVPIEEIHLDTLGNLGLNDSSALRQAANAPIQGSSADIIKLAMIEMHKILPQYQAKMLLQVHDELIFEMPESEYSILQPLIAQTMENAVKLAVPLVVEMGKGDNWMAAK
jgi:DNA polymerase I